MFTNKIHINGMSYPQYSKGRCFAIKRFASLETRVVEIDESFEIIWASAEGQANSLMILDDLILYSIYKRKTICRCIDNLDDVRYAFDFSLQLHPNNMVDGHYYLDNVKGLGFVRIDLAAGKLVSVLSSERSLFQNIYFEGGVIRFMKGHPTILLAASNFEVLWEKDLNDLCHQADEEEGIDDVYKAGEKIIVLAKRLIIALDSGNGNLLWHQRLSFPPIALSVHESEAYMLAGQHFAVIDLNSGQIALDKKLEDFVFNGRTLQFDGYGRVYHEGLVWCCLQTNGYYFVAAIYPEDGRVVWLEHVNTPHSIHPPKFKEDKMYVLDTGGNLHIYQKSVT
jgi:hypothetical protein